MRAVSFRAAAFLLTGFLASVAPAAAQSPIRLAWNPSDSTTTGYQVHYGTAPGQYTGFVDVGNTSAANWQPPAVNRVYYFVILAYNASGQLSGPSNEAAAWYGQISRTPALLSMGDFNGDGRADATVYRGTTGQWFSRYSNGGSAQVNWGAPALGDVPVAADYDGDGRTDFAVFRKASGEWFLARSRDGGITYGWGAPALGDLPVPADYDNDGKADVAVFRESTGQWFIRQSTNGGLRQVNWGMAGGTDVPVPGDYDGDGRADVAVYRRTTGQWFVNFVAGAPLILSWGSPTHADTPIPADYDGDGITDLAVFRMVDGTWVARLSSTGGVRTAGWGSPASGDMPVAADFDGDGRADFAVFRASTSAWYIAYASGQSTSFQWGSPALGDTVSGQTEFQIVPFK